MNSQIQVRIDGLVNNFGIFDYSSLDREQAFEAFEELKKHCLTAFGLKPDTMKTHHAPLLEPRDSWVMFSWTDFVGRRVEFVKVNENSPEFINGDDGR